MDTLHEGLSVTPLTDLSIDSDLLALARECADRIIKHPDWDILAGRYVIAHLRKTVPTKFSTITPEYEAILSPAYVSFVREHADALDSFIVPERDMQYTYFAVNTFMNSYLGSTRTDGKKVIHELPQYMWMRVAITVSRPQDGVSSLDRVKQVYDSLSQGYYTHASPTLFNAGMRCPQLASCFLMDVQDSLDDITMTWRKQAFISKFGGGIGCDVSRLRHSEIAGFGESSGIVNWVRDIGMVLETVNQSGKRKGSGCVYLCDWHTDICEFVEMRMPTGSDEMRSRKLFYAVYVSDLFMKRVSEDGVWSLMCPNKCPGLVDNWGEAFEELYLGYEAAGKFTRQLPARALLHRIINVQIQTGMPFIVYKDSVNRKSNQKHLGTIQCSNLCTEIVQYVSPDEISMCNLASIALPKYVTSSTEADRFDFDALGAKVAEVVRNLDNVIDCTFYIPQVPQIRTSNMRHRPMGIGVQGLADVFIMLRMEWGSEEALKLEHDIFECMYYHALRESITLAIERGQHPSFPGSPLSHGELQPDMWNPSRFPPRYDFGPLREQLQVSGVRNSLLLAIMPTASTAQMLGNSENIEPYTTNLFTRTVLSGQFIVINRFLVRDLMKLGMWTSDTFKTIARNNGSIADLAGPNPFITRKLEKLKRLYRTAYEIPLHIQVDHMAERSRYICQSASFNCFMKSPTPSNLAAWHLYTWRKGLKTGMYYLRQLATVDPVNFSIGDISFGEHEDEEACVACSA